MFKREIEQSGDEASRYGYSYPVRYHLKEYIFPEEQWEDYQGQKLFRGDAVKSDVYFSEGKDIRVCELLKRHKNGWYAWDLKGKRQVMLDEKMVIQVLHDEWYENRRENPENYKYYWQIRDFRERH